MPVLSGWPVVTDDSGSGQDGTILNRALTDSIRASVEASINSPTNPTVTPIATTDEVVLARGSKTSLDARLDVSLNNDGTLIVPATIGLVTDIAALLNKNLAPNSDFLLWPAGDAAAPSYWTLSGAGAVVARTGTALGDTFNAGCGDFGVKLTYGSQTVKLTQTLLNAAAFTRASVLKGKKLYLTAFVKSSTANAASITIDDGVAPQTSAFHTGGGTTELLSISCVISNSATKLEIYLSNAVAGDAYFAGVFPVFSTIAPSFFLPCEMQKGLIQFVYSGAVATGTQLSDFLPGAPGIITDCQLYAKTAPTGQALKVDVNTWDAAAFTTAFTTKPQIAAAVKRGVSQAPDGTYARRCFTPDLTATGAAGSGIDYDVDQVGSGVAGSDLTIDVRVRQYIRALEAYLSYDQV